MLYNIFRKSEKFDTDYPTFLKLIVRAGVLLLKKEVIKNEEKYKHLLHYFETCWGDMAPISMLVIFARFLLIHAHLNIAQNATSIEARFFIFNKIKEHNKIKILKTDKRFR